MKRLVKQKAPSTPKQLAVGQVWKGLYSGKLVVCHIVKSPSGRYTDVFLAHPTNVDAVMVDKYKRDARVPISAFGRRWMWKYIGEYNRSLDEGECV